MSGCCFIGHRQCPTEVRARLYKAAEELIVNRDVRTFYVGTQGGFDRMVYTVLCDLEKYYNIEIVVVLAYLGRSAEEVYYDYKKTVFPEELTKTPPRFAIRRRNDFMIEHSEYVVTYVETRPSNAYTNVQRALAKKKRIICLGSLPIGV